MLKKSDLEDVITRYHHIGKRLEYIEGYLQACYTQELIKSKEWQKLLNIAYKLYNLEEIKR